MSEQLGPATPSPDEAEEHRLPEWNAPVMTTLTEAEVQADPAIAALVAEMRNEANQ